MIEAIQRFCVAQAGTSFRSEFSKENNDLRAKRYNMQPSEVTPQPKVEHNATVKELA